MSEPVTRDVAIDVRNTCLCLATQRAARILARRFDRAFAGLGITNNQYSLMMTLSGPEPPLMSRIAPALAMDRTTLTAALKALEKRGLVTVQPDAEDKRGRRARLTEAGRHAIASATAIWRAEHAALEQEVQADMNQLRALLAALG
jgi:DNA-binding MarR family transcriptional regulator